MQRCALAAAYARACMINLFAVLVWSASIGHREWESSGAIHSIQRKCRYVLLRWPASRLHFYDHGRMTQHLSRRRVWIFIRWANGNKTRWRSDQLFAWSHVCAPLSVAWELADTIARLSPMVVPTRFSGLLVAVPLLKNKFLLPVARAILDCSSKNYDM